MTEKEYLDRSSAINSKITELRIKGQQLDKEYLTSNLQFEKGQKVKLTRDGDFVRFAFIKGGKIGYSGKIEYLVNKCKKDGTESQVQDYIYGNLKIEKL